MRWAKINIIDAHKKFTPSFSMIAVNGILPDVKISQYKDLFRPIEWELITRDSPIIKAERSLMELIRKGFSSDTLKAYIETLDRIKVEIRDDNLASTIRQIRRDRLRFAVN
jgi:hypothetical protein